MAILPRSLCLIVTLWTVSSRPLATIPLESPNPGPWRKATQGAILPLAARRSIVAFPVNKAVNNIENFRSRTSLIHFQEGLGDSELLLSFHLGESDSYLWAVTRKTLSRHRLPPARRLRREVWAFRDWVRSGRADSERVGERLYAELFGDLKPGEARKPVWLLSLEDALFELPFAALTERRRGKMAYLVEKHSLQIVPGVPLLKPDAGLEADATADWFLGVGDPIYNAADPRWRPLPSLGFSRLFGETTDGAGQLSRLVASGGEIDASARSWSAGSGTAILLRGADARREKFLGLLNHRPSIVHLATHVISPAGSRGRPSIVFGLRSSAETEFLTTSEVASLHVPGVTVVMTGCDSGAGPGAGLMGFTRAWELAGARAVLATAWAVKDSNGGIFESFYRHLRGESAAEALRHSQTEMIRSATWRASPSYWASYQISGGVQ
jgi:CHAT domain-containing protein